MNTTDTRASSVKEIEEAFSCVESKLFTPLYYPQHFDSRQLMALVHAAQKDSRKAVLKRSETAQKRLYRYLEEVERTRELYAMDAAEGVGRGLSTHATNLTAKDSVRSADQLICDGSDRNMVEEASTPNAPRIVVGLDEVGRGPLAGPVVIGAVVLDPSFYILGLNDSKKLSSKKREELAAIIHRHAKAVFLEQNTAEQIDEKGISRAVRDSFYGALQRAVEHFEEKNIARVCIDGLPLHIHPKECAFVKGDSKVASIAAASIVAKVARDSYMKDLAPSYPSYGFEKNKGYGSAEHIAAIKACGLSAVHRKTFCSHFV